jgi:hypothetical protein
MLLALAVVRSASPESVHVAYVVECPDFLRAGSRLQRGLTLEVYATRRCDGPALMERYVVVDAVAAPGRRADGRPSTDTTRRPPALTLEADIVLETPPSEIYLRLDGTGVKPVGDACQRQAGRGVPLAKECSPDSIRSKDLCVDRYEASLWEIPAARVDLVCKVIEGTATVADLTSPDVRQVGFPGAPFGHAAVPGSFLAEGGYTTPLYAAALPGVLPSTYVSAYQAWAACGFSGKRLPTSEEWIAAASGTPARTADDTSSACNTGAGPISAGVPVKTGSRSACVSRAGAFDMVGNVSEWTMDGHSRTHYRGGAWDSGDDYGMAFTQPELPHTQDNAVGFRCVR